LINQICCCSIRDTDDCATGIRDKCIGYWLVPCIDEEDTNSSDTCFKRHLNVIQCHIILDSENGELLEHLGEHSNGVDHDEECKCGNESEPLDFSSSCTIMHYLYHYALENPIPWPTDHDASADDE
jgi:hypothetical protein